MTAFVAGLVVGACFGILLFGLLVGPRIAELQDTVASLRSLIDFMDASGQASGQTGEDWQAVLADLEEREQR